MRRISAAYPILLVAIGAFVWMHDTSTSLPDQKVAAPVVETTIVALDYYPTRLEVHGEVKSRLNPSITSKIQGDIHQVLVHEGESVKKNQVLVRLHSDKVALDLQQVLHKQEQLWQQIAQTKSRQQHEKKALEHQQALELLQQKEVNRYQYLYEHEQVAKITLERAQQNYLNAALKTLELQSKVDTHKESLEHLYQDYYAHNTLVKKAKIDYDRLTIKAPYAGKIQSIAIKQGDRVRENTPVLRLFSPDSLEVHAQIPSQYRMHMAPDKTLGHIVHNQGMTWLKLKTIEKHINQNTGSHTAIFQALTPESLTMGEWNYIVIEQKTTQLSTLIPQSALYFNDTIYRLDEGQVLQALHIEVLGEALSHPGFVVVSSPELSSGQLIMTTHLPFAESGMKVSIWDANT